MPGAAAWDELFCTPIQAHIYYHSMYLFSVIRVLRRIWVVLGELEARLGGLGGEIE